MRTLRRAAGLLCVLLVLPMACEALVVGTYNMEYFSITGEDRFTFEEVQAVAQKIISSGADILALQEVADQGSLSFLVARHLPGWSFRIDNTRGRQDLAFLWNKNTVAMVGPIRALFRGETYRDPRRGPIVLFDKPPIHGTFIEKGTGFHFGMANVHLKSDSTQGQRHRREALEYSRRKRDAQIDRLNDFARRAREPLFILGDYNDPDAEADFPLLTLEDGFSYDARGTNVDYVGYVRMVRGPSWRVYEVEGSVPSRSFRNRESPDHDLVLLKVD